MARFNPIFTFPAEHHSAGESEHPEFPEPALSYDTGPSAFQAIYSDEAHESANPTEWHLPMSVSDARHPTTTEQKMQTAQREASLDVDFEVDVAVTERSKDKGRGSGDRTGASGTARGNKLWQCWDHRSCNGREFSSRSNLLRHQKEKSKRKAASASSDGGSATSSHQSSPIEDGRSGDKKDPMCLLCGAVFTRNSARNTHLANQSCNRIRRYSNGRTRPSKVPLANNPNLVEGLHY